MIYYISIYKRVSNYRDSGGGPHVEVEKIKHSGWKIVPRDEQREPVKAREIGLLGAG